MRHTLILIIDVWLLQPLGAITCEKPAPLKGTAIRDDVGGDVEGECASSLEGNCRTVGVQGVDES
jgi:hypothetical protein